MDAEKDGGAATGAAGTVREVCEERLCERVDARSGVDRLPAQSAQDRIGPGIVGRSVELATRELALGDFG
jgi:hypothetical protein